MSRLARKLIPIPENISVTPSDDSVWIFRGPKGELRQKFSPLIRITLEGSGARISLDELLNRGNKKNAPAHLGTVTALFKNAILGVTIGFEEKLEIEGVGFKVQPDGADLIFSIGFSHPVHFKVPKEVSCTIEKNSITLRGVDRSRVGQIAAKLRALKPPEPYKGKGIRYANEIIRRKAGKKAVGTT